MAKIRDPKIHWFAFDCHHFDHHMRDSFTNTPILVTCGICKRHVKRILSHVLTTASTVTAAPVELWDVEEEMSDNDATGA